MARAALKAAAGALDERDVMHAMTLRNFAAMNQVADPAIVALGESLAESIPAALTATLKAAGHGTVERLLDRAALRAAQHGAVHARSGFPGLPGPPVGPADTEMAFDVTDPRAVAWIQQHATELISDLSDTTRTVIRDALTAAFEGEQSSAQATKAIAAAVDDPVRAKLIARTESGIAASEGQREAWDQAVDEGLLDGTEKREWIWAGLPDTRGKYCPHCQSLDGQVVGLDEPYVDDEGTEYEGPIAHSNCECTEELA